MPTRLRDLMPQALRRRIGEAGRRAWARIGTPLQRPVPPGSIIAVCHCHHVALVPELARKLLCLPRGATLYVTSADAAVFDAWAPYRQRSLVPIRFHPVENRGRDLRAFFEVAGKLDVSPDTLVLKIHGKRSSYTAQGDWWRRDIIRGLFPGPFAVQRIVGAFRDDPRLALVGAPNTFISHPVYWGRNRDGVAAMMQSITGQSVTDEDLGFLAGSMFWIRGGFLSSLVPSIDFAAFEPEPLGQDGSYAHTVERVIGMAALAQGWHIGEVGHPDPLTRDDVRHRKVSYL